MAAFSFKVTTTKKLKACGMLDLSNMTIEINGEDKKLSTLLSEYDGSLQGDMLSGNIHKTIQVTNRENVIEQVKVASELISSFCYELTKIFSKVFLSSVSGNHSRIDRKEEALHDERLDDIITWGIELSLRHIENFHVLKRNIDNGIADLNIRGKTYIAIHGDMDQFNKTENGKAEMIEEVESVFYECLIQLLFEKFEER